MYPRTPQDIAAVRARFALPERFLVWVGGLQHPDPGKHIAKLAAAPRELPLVLVGSTRPWAHELPDVILTDQVSDEQLAAIYSGAHALVLSSKDEGFGLPAVEALACGTPVVACDAPALREVLGERRDVRGAGGHGGPDRSRAGRAATGPAAAAVELAGRGARHLGRVCAGDVRRPAAAHGRADTAPPPGGSRGNRRSRASVGAPPQEHGGNRLQQDRQVERERPALEVDEVQVHEIVEVELGAA